MSRNIIELLAAAAETYLSELFDPVEIERLQNYSERVNRIVAPRTEARTSAQVIQMTQHPAAKRRNAPVARRFPKKLAAVSGYRQHWVNEYGDAIYDD